MNGFIKGITECTVSPLLHYTWVSTSTARRADKCMCILLIKDTRILATRDTQFGQGLAPVMQTTHDSIPMCRLEFVFFHWKCTQVLQKSLSLSIKYVCFKRYHHDLLRHLVAFSKFEWFISSDHKIKNFSTHFIHKL